MNTGDVLDPLGMVHDKGGDGKKKEKYHDVQAQLARQLFEQTDPLRQLLIGQSTDFLSGGADVTQTPAYQNLQLQTGRNFNQAKDNMIARFAPGGGLVDALTGLESDRASTLSSGAAGIYDAEQSRALGLGTGTTGVALGSLGQAANVQAMRHQANSMEQAAKTQTTGDAVGSFAGGK